MKSKVLDLDVEINEVELASSELTAVGIRCADHTTPYLLARLGTNFADKRRSLGRYSSLADYGHGV
jgi:hypothetical protein